MRTVRPPRPRRLVLALMLFGVGSIAWADGDKAPRVTSLPAYTQECAACHLAFPPGLLPAASWQRVLNGLPRHYGTDASLDAATTNTLSAWLVANAATRRKTAVEPPDDRITRAAWFVHEHDKVAAAAWKRPAIKSPANCGACHPQAVQGDFNEHQIRIPG